MGTVDSNLQFPNPEAAIARLLSLEEAAEILGYSPSGLRKIVRRTREGKPGPTIRFFQIGNGPIRFRPEWIDEFIDANSVKPQVVSLPLNRTAAEQSETELRNWRRPA